MASECLKDDRLHEIIVKNICFEHNRGPGENSEELNPQDEGKKLTMFQ